MISKSKLIEDQFDSICFGLDGASEAGEHEWESYGTVAREDGYDVVGYECLRCDHVAYTYNKVEE